MNLSFNSKSTENKTKKKILFSCIENAGRSQMAEVYLENTLQKTLSQLVQERVINLKSIPCVEVIGEIDIDRGSQNPKDLTGEMMRNATKIINMVCMNKDFCPTLFVPKVVDCGIEDHKDNPIDKVRETRDETEIRINEILKEKDTQCITIATFMP
jgi:arsenate reductase